MMMKIVFKMVKGQRKIITIYILVWEVLMERFRGLFHNVQWRAKEWMRGIWDSDNVVLQCRFFYERLL